MEGAVVAVTGASSGIGAATAKVLARGGASVVLLARRQERLEQVLGSMERAQDPERPHTIFPCDVADSRSVAAAFAGAGARFGRLDGLVCNAGIGAFFPVDSTPEEALRALVETNLAGVVRCIREAAPWLERARGPGRIVLVGSIAGRRGFPGLGVYSATKAALYGLADALRVELAPRGITTSVVAPGRTASEFQDAALRAARTPGDAAYKDAAAAPGAAPAEAVAHAIAAALRTGRPESTPGRPGRLITLANVLFPRLFDRRLARHWPG